MKLLLFFLENVSITRKKSNNCEGYNESELELENEVISIHQRIHYGY